MSNNLQPNINPISAQKATRRVRPYWWVFLALIFLILPNRANTDSNNYIDEYIDEYGVGIYITKIIGPDSESYQSLCIDPCFSLDSRSGIEFNPTFNAGTIVVSNAPDDYQVTPKEAAATRFEDEILKTQPPGSEGEQRGRNIGVEGRNIVNQRIEEQTRDTLLAELDDGDLEYERSAPAEFPNEQGARMPAAADAASKPYDMSPAKVTGSDPINYANGEFIHQTEDMFIPNARTSFSLIRTYRSRVNYIGPLGHGWDHSYNQRITMSEDNEQVFYHNGHAATITLYPDTQYNRNADRREDRYIKSIGDRLEAYRSLDDGQFRLSDRHGRILSFRSGDGWLETVGDIHGPQIQLYYSGQGDNARLEYITDSANREIRFEYHDAPPEASYPRFLERVYFVNGDLRYEVAYAYDTNGNLNQYTDANGMRLSYEYLAGIEGETDYLPDFQLFNYCDDFCSSRKSGGKGFCEDQITEMREKCAYAEKDCIENSFLRCKEFCGYSEDFETSEAILYKECDLRWSEQAPDLAQLSQDVCGDFMWSKGNPYCSTECYLLARKWCEDQPCDDMGNCVSIGVKISFATPEPVPPEHCTMGPDQFLALIEWLCSLPECLVESITRAVSEQEIECPDTAFKYCKKGCKNCILEGDCSRDSPNHGVDCIDSCEQTLRESCESLIRPDLSSAATQSCRSAWENSCIYRCNQQASELCEVCDTMDFEAKCCRRCQDDCISQLRYSNDAIAYGYATDLNHNLVKIKDEQGNVLLTNVFGGIEEGTGANAVIDVTSPNFDRVIQQRFADQDEIISVEYEDLARSEPARDKAGLSEDATWLAKVTDRRGAVTHFTYNGQGNVLLSHWIEEGKEFRYRYNRWGKLASVSLPDGNIIGSSYDHWGNLTRVGYGYYTAITTKLYYTNHTPPRLFKVMDPRDWDPELQTASTLVEYVYSDNARLKNIILGNGEISSYAYDDQGRVDLITDPSGSKTKLEYDQWGNVHRLHRAYEAPIQKTTTFEHDAIGRLLSTTNHLGVQTEFDLDFLWRPRTITRAANIESLRAQVNFTRDYRGNLTEVVAEHRSPLSSEQLEPVRVQYDYWRPLGRLKAVTRYPGGIGQAAETIQYTYYPQGDLKQIVADGVTTDYTLDTRGRLRSITSSGQDVEPTTYAYEYNDMGRLWKIQDPLERTLILTRDEFGRLNGAIRPDGLKTVFTLDKLGNVLTRSHYEAHGDQQTMPNPTGDESNPHLLSRTDYSYDSQGRIQTIDLWHFNSSEQGPEFIGDGRVTVSLARIRQRDPAANAIASISDYAGRVKWIFDQLGRISQIQSVEAGDTINFEYDSLENSVARLDIDSRNNRIQGTKTYYDLIDRLEKSLDPYGRTIRYSYDSLDRLVRVASPRGNETVYDYDGMSRLLTITSTLHENADGLRPVDTSNPYNSDGLVTTRFLWKWGSLLDQVIDDRGQITRFYYDGLNRLQKTIWPDASMEVRGYNRAEELTSLTDPLNRIHRYTYDTAGRLRVHSVQSKDPRVGGAGSEAPYREFSYDGLDRITHAYTTNQIDSHDDSSIERRYDSLGTLIYEKNNLTPFGAITAQDLTGMLPHQRITELTLNMLDNPVIRRTYDESGKLKKIAVAQDNIVDIERGFWGRLQSLSYGNGVVQSFAFDLNENNTENTLHNASRNLLLKRQYVFGQEDLLIRADAINPDKNETSSTFMYDSLGRLVRESHGLPLLESDEPNENDIECMMDHYRAAPRKQYYELDGVDNWRKVEGSDEGSFETISNVSAGDRYQSFGQRGTLTYDNAGYLIQESNVGSYQFDRFGELTKFTPRDGEAIDYSYDAFGRLVSKKGAGESEATYFSYFGGALLGKGKASDPSTHRSYIYGEGRMPWAVLSSGSARKYMHPDRLDSVMAVTNANGELDREYRFSAFGIPSLLDESGMPVPGVDENTVFGSLWYDQDLGAYSALMRTYSPFLGRFLSPDPVFRGGINRYAYAAGCPTHFVDPFGLDPASSFLSESFPQTPSELADLWRGLGWSVGPLGVLPFTGEDVVEHYQKSTAPIFDALTDLLPQGNGIAASAVRNIALADLTFVKTTLDVGVGMAAGSADPQSIVRGILKWGETTASGVEDIERGDTFLGVSKITGEAATTLGIALGGVQAVRTFAPPAPKSGKITGRILRKDLPEIHEGAAYEFTVEHLKDILIDPKQLKGKLDLYKKAYHESAHRWMKTKTSNFTKKVLTPSEEEIAGAYGWAKGNLRYYFNIK